MEQAILGIQIAILLILIIGGLFIKSYLPSYFSEKAKNLATREDIEEITDKIEGIRAQHTAELEKLRASLIYATGEQTKLRERQTEALLKFYDTCLLVMEAAITIKTIPEDEPDNIRERLKEISHLCIAISQQRVRLVLYMPPEDKLYQAVVDINNQVTKFYSMLNERLTPITIALGTASAANLPPTLKMIDELNKTIDTSLDSISKCFTTFLIEFREYATNYREHLTPASNISNKH